MSIWLSKDLGTNSLKHDFNYDPAQADVGGINFGQVANQMLEGTGTFMEAQRAHGAKAVQDAAAQSRQTQDMAMAQRGMGQSSMYAEAMAEGIMRGALPIAQADAQVYKDKIYLL